MEDFVRWETLRFAQIHVIRRTLISFPLRMIKIGRVVEQSGKRSLWSELWLNWGFRFGSLAGHYKSLYKSNTHSNCLHVICLGLKVAHPAKGLFQAAFDPCTWLCIPSPFGGQPQEDVRGPPKRGLAEDALSGVEGTKCIRCEWLRCKKMKNSTAVEQDTAKTLQGYILADLKMSSLISLKHRIVITQSTSLQHIAVNEQILPSVYMYEEI